MNKKYIFIIIVTALIAGSTVELRHLFANNLTKTDTTTDSTIHSPYSGQETRRIKALSEDDIKGLLTGTGTPLGGMAKPAELNGYPGPRHVLDAIEAGEFNVTAEQKVRIEKLYEEMKAHAIILGEKIVAAEQRIDDEFVGNTATEESLRNNIAMSVDSYKQLRFVHLKYHLLMKDVLTPKQIEQYNLLRGYVGGDPCKSIPSGHDPKLWKTHNDCE